jgi:hypothetical protein
VKVDAPELVHKTDLGGVRLDITGEDEVRRAFADLIAAVTRAGREPRGVLVQPMAAPGVELIVGVRRDALVGPIVVAGLGGIHAEVLDDVSVALAPITPTAARELLLGLRGAALLTGARGHAPVDLDALAALIAGLGDLIVTRPELAAVDLNPVVAGSGHVVAVDAVVISAAGS